jgi:1-acyl-sn-glycerol-3-phosphate acyltransferase
MILGKLRAFLTIIQMVITVTITIILMYIFRNNTKKIRRAWAAMQLKLLGIKLEVQGEADPQANMQIMNHQSVLDIIIFEYFEKKDSAWVAKKEIADIPWFGRILKAPDMIIVQRESKSSLVQLIKDVKIQLDKNRPIFMFPEGTRGKGDKLLKFKPGAKMVAEKYNLLVQPVVIIGTRDILDSQNLIQKSGTVKIIYLDAIKAQRKTDWYEQCEQSMKDTLNTHIAQVIDK